MKRNFAKNDLSSPAVALTGATAGELRSFLAKFLFTGDDVHKKVGDLSGGEKGRLALAKLIYSRVNVLVLDEPTNHLDIPSREALEEALDAYEGTILTISHDRYFLDRVATQMLALDGQGAAEHYDGDYTEYHEWRAGRLSSGAVSKAAENAVPANLVRADPLTPVPSREEASSQTPRSTKQTAKGKKNASQESSQSSGVKVIKKKKVEARTPETLEVDIAQTETRLNEISQQMGEPGIARDATRLIQLNDEYQETETRLQLLYAEWDRVSAEAPKV